MLGFKPPSTPVIKQTTLVNSQIEYEGARAPFYQYDLTLIPACMSNFIHYDVWDEITYPFQNSNGTAIEL